MKVLGFRFAQGEIFRDLRALCVEFVDFGLEGAGGGCAGRIDQTVCGCVYGFFETVEVCLLGFSLRLPVCDAAVPNVLEHGAGDGQEAMAGREILQEGVKSTFNFCPFDRLAAIGAALLEAFIIGIAFVSAFGPIACHGMATGGAGDVTAQGKVLMAGLLLRGGGFGRKFLLDTLERVPGDDGRVVSFGKCHSPGFVFIIARIDFVGEHVADALGVDTAVDVA
jgi:hypothetical protein